MANPAGTNSPVAFDQFTREIPYGEKRVQGDLQRTVPMAGQGAAATPLNLPRAAERAATSATTRPQSASTAASIAQPSEPSPAQVFAHLASLPGATPLIAEYARRSAL